MFSVNAIKEVYDTDLRENTSVSIKSRGNTLVSKKQISKSQIEQKHLKERKKRKTVSSRLKPNNKRRGDKRRGKDENHGAKQLHLDRLDKEYWKEFL